MAERARESAAPEAAPQAPLAVECRAADTDLVAELATLAVPGHEDARVDRERMAGHFDLGHDFDVAVGSVPNHFAHVVLRRALADDSERSWQIVRRLMRRANEWVSVDPSGSVTSASRASPSRFRLTSTSPLG